jgi:hypothetical protein
VNRQQAYALAHPLTAANITPRELTRELRLPGAQLARLTVAVDC